MLDPSFSSLIGEISAVVLSPSDQGVGGILKGTATLEACESDIQGLINHVNFHKPDQSR